MDEEITEFEEGDVVYYYNTNWKGTITHVDEGFYGEYYYHVHWTENTHVKYGRYLGGDLMPESFYDFKERIKDRL